MIADETTMSCKSIYAALKTYFDPLYSEETSALHSEIYCTMYDVFNILKTWKIRVDKFDNHSIQYLIRNVAWQ